MSEQTNTADTTSIVEDQIAATMKEIQDADPAIKAIKNLANRLGEVIEERDAYRRLCDAASVESTHPDRDTPGCYWCIAGRDDEHEEDCPYLLVTGGPRSSFP